MLKLPRTRTSDVKVAICGAGVAGGTLAEMLSRSSRVSEVHLFEMGRGLGGRAATRKPRAQPGMSFDHGFQYVTAACGLDVSLINEWEEKGLLHPWGLEGTFAQMQYLSTGEIKVSTNNPNFSCGATSSLSPELRGVFMDLGMHPGTFANRSNDASASPMHHSGASGNSLYDEQAGELQAQRNKPEEYLSELPYVGYTSSSNIVEKLVADNPKIKVHCGTRVVPSFRGVTGGSSPTMPSPGGAKGSKPERAWRVRKWVNAEDAMRKREGAADGAVDDSFTEDSFDFFVSADRLFLSIKGEEPFFSRQETAELLEPIQQLLYREIESLPVITCMLAARPKGERVITGDDASGPAASSKDNLLNGIHYLKHPILKWASRENAKPGRGAFSYKPDKAADPEPVDCWVAMSNPTWTKGRIDELRRQLEFEEDMPQAEDDEAGQPADSSTFFEKLRERCNALAETEVLPAFIQSLKLLYPDWEAKNEIIYQVGV